MSYKSELMEMTSGVETQIGKRSKVDRKKTQLTSPHKYCSLLKLDREVTTEKGIGGFSE